MNNRDHQYDVRVVERLLRSGQLSTEQYNTWMENLEDSGPESETSHVNMVFTRQPGSKDLDGVGDDDGDDEAG